MTSRKVDSDVSGATLLPLLHLAGVPTWEMPHLTSLNRLPPRATLIPYPSAGDALQRPREESPWFHPLNGVWDFKIFGRPEQVTHAAVEHGCVVADRRAGQLDDAGLWPAALHQRADALPQPAARRAGRKSHRRLPAHLHDCRQAGRIAASCSTLAAAKARSTSMSTAQPVGLSKDARTPAEFDITDRVHLDGENELLVVVTQWSDAAFIEDQDIGGRPA